VYLCQCVTIRFQKSNLYCSISNLFFVTRQNEMEILDRIYIQNQGPTCPLQRNPGIFKLKRLVSFLMRRDQSDRENPVTLESLSSFEGLAVNQIILTRFLKKKSCKFKLKFMVFIFLSLFLLNSNQTGVSGFGTS
jgi:hypothetical protein